MNMEEFQTENREQILKTGTTGLALRFKGGVLIAADKRVSAGYSVGKNAQKIHAITDKVAMAISGLVSDAMNLVDVMKSELKLYTFDNGQEPTVKMASSLLSVIMHAWYRRYFPYFAQLLVGGVDVTGEHVYSIGIDGSVIEDNYHVIGSGSLFALSKLEDGWKEGLTKDEAMALAKQAMRLAISRDLYTGDGMDFFFITKDGIKTERITLQTTEVLG